MFYGLGWRIYKNKDGKTFIFHSGHFSGMFAMIGFIPSEDIGIIYITNSSRKKDGRKKIITSIPQDIIDFAIRLPTKIYYD